MATCSGPMSSSKAAVGAVAVVAAAEQPGLTVPVVDLAEPLPPSVLVCTPFFSLPAGSVSGPVPFQ